MQAMQRHPQRTRGSKQGMSFDAGGADGWVRWTVRARVGLAAGEANLENITQTLSTTPRSERPSPAQQTATGPSRPPSVNPLAKRLLLRAPDRGSWRQSAVAISLPVQALGQYEVTVGSSKRSRSISRNAFRTGPLSSILVAFRATTIRFFPSSMTGTCSNSPVSVGLYRAGT
ncbi:hypothetical protein M440DRAFT_1258640 [Trichoderma longibrachiatum ATCC 18648]|uniref:Uncharacterized protein n=1 Tax=Trichoderma longibrachiatum ATCC 18648 TaxID=983965 RepID=A0A2T4C266_TRILO|nr:hypothetical protein M440DRAFT_1258640 [Trichoderma longibrachiatum ATCC 18648]